jgi:hypothetical protein
MDQTVSDEELERCAKLSENPGELNVYLLGIIVRL